MARSYDYQCNECGDIFEVLRQWGEEELNEPVHCASCESDDCEIYWGSMNFMMSGKFDTPRRKD